MYRRSILLLALLVPAVAAYSVMQADEPVEPLYMAVVRQLGASSYAEREEAARKLLAIGVAAQPALMRGLEFDDLEIRLGSHRLLVQVLQNDFDYRITAFILDQGPDGTHDLPGWPQFRARLGDNVTARRLYAEMLRAENDLTVAVGCHDSSLEKKLIERIQSLASSKMFGGGRRQTVSGATLATVLFAGMQVQDARAAGGVVPTVSSLTGRVFSLLNNDSVKQSLRQGAFSPQIKQLLARWIEGVGNSKEQHGWYYAMQLSLQLDLRGPGPRIARKVLKNPGSSANSIPYAAMVLGRFGTAEDGQYLTPHLANTQVFHTWSNPPLKTEPIRIQVRDAVLAITIRLSGEDPADYGFKLLQDDEHTMYKVYTFGFLENAERDAAFAKWATRGKPREKDETAKAKTSAAAGDAAEPIAAGHKAVDK